MEQFMVPQFIENESKVIGSISVRQFLILLGTAGVIFLLYVIFSAIAFILLGLMALFVGLVFAFVKINSQPFHIFALNMFQTLRRPSLKTWGRIFVKPVEWKAKETLIPFVPKSPLIRSRLAELSLVVDTGGAYIPEE